MSQHLAVATDRRCHFFVTKWPFPSPSWPSLLLAIVATVALTGCGGGGTGDSPGPLAPQSNLPNYHSPEEWIALIETAGLMDYANLGRELLSEQRVKLVAPPLLDEQFNAYSWIADREIWINTPMFARYPGIVEQATIFLHELIHISSMQSTHTGPAWAAQDQFAVYWRNHPLSP